jgi:hypothetical protein
VNPDGTDRVVTVKTVSDAKPHSGKHLLKDKGIHTSKTRKKHLEGGKEAEKLYEKGDAKHVFRDDVDLDRTIDEVMDRGEYVGVDEHGYHRWVKRSDEPVGVRKKMGDEDQSLHYVEVKAKQNPDGTWSYHADPRGRPPESTKARKIDTTHPDPRFTSGQEANFGGE